MSFKIPTYDNFTTCYKALIEDVYKNPDYECAPRGMAIREKIGISFKILDPRNRLPYIAERNYSIAYMLGELLWVMAGRNDVEWIATYSPFWLNVTDDGSTSSSAPGYRIFKKHPRIDNGSHIQYERVLNELKSDRDSRRAILYFTQPTDHFVSKLDIGCVTTAQFFIRDDKLHLVTNMRSSDLILGLPYDVGIFTIVQEMLAMDLGIDVGELIWHANSEHIYERNFEIAEAVCDSPKIDYNCPQMPHMIVKPPVAAMIDFEGRCRASNTVEELRGVIETIPVVSNDEYWLDWCRIYAGHRAKKISKPLKIALYKSCTFKGYSFFKK